MWGFTSNDISGSLGANNDFMESNKTPSECSDEDISVTYCREEGLECPICWESFNIVENVPYVLWCGHTLCKNCVLGLQRAVVKLPTLAIRLPFFISCPWCNLLSFRLVYKGNLKFPSKNFFLLWMVESRNGDWVMSHSSSCRDHQPISRRNLAPGNQASHINHSCAPRTFPTQQTRPSQNAGNLVDIRRDIERLRVSLCKSLVFFGHLTTKFPLVIVFLLIVLYVVPASAAILVLYILITILFAVPSFLVLYFAYPSLDWLVREIVS